MLSHRTYLLTLLVVVWCIAQPSATAQFGQQGSKLVGTGVVGNGYQGFSVSLSADGSTAIVGGYADNSAAGAAWVYTRSGGVWSQQGSKLVGTGAVDPAYQGTSASLSADGNTAIVGGWGDNSYAGAAWVYTRSGGVWSQQGSKLVGTGAVDPAYQGVSVSLSADGNTAIVGGYYDNSYAGAAWVYTRSGGVWSQQGSKLVGTGAVGTAFQGVSVSLSADGYTAIVGGYGDNSFAGAAWVWINGAPNIAAIKDVANDQGGKIRVMWDPSRLDALPNTTVRSYTVWMGTKTTGVVGNIGSTTARISRKAGPPEKTVSDAIYWQSAGSVAAHWLSGYSCVVSTYADSGLQGIPMYYFQVTAQAADSTIFWTSNVDSGYSLDNIPPDPPASMVGNVVSGTVDMKWKKNKEPDFWRYAIYRSDSSISDPSHLTPLATTDDTTFADANPITGGRSYYVVCAQDIHGNQSTRSNRDIVSPFGFHAFSQRDFIHGECIGLWSKT